MNTKTIFISVGEASGDLHAANLVKNLNRIYPKKIQYFGMGGQLMRKQGVNILVEIDKLSVIGITGVIAHLPQIIRTFYTIKKFLKQQKPDLVILVDYPGFNLRLAKTAKKLGLKVLYYISPQLWAWHQSRVKIVKKYVDLMAVILPFEIDFYKKFDVNAVLTKHPLLDTAVPSMTKEIARKFFNLNPDAITIGLLPGSRSGEIERLLPTMIATAQLLKTHNKNIQFILPLASSLKKAALEKYLPANLAINIVTNAYDAINSCDAVIACSGTVTLEIALLKIPMVIVYQVAWLNYHLIKMAIKVPYVGLCNIIAQEKIVAELLQHDASPQNIADEIIKILENEDYREQMIAKLEAARNKLAQSNIEIATVVEEILDSK